MSQNVILFGPTHPEHTMSKPGKPGTGKENETRSTIYCREGKKSANDRSVKPPTTSQSKRNVQSGGINSN